MDRLHGSRYKRHSQQGGRNVYRLACGLIQVIFSSTRINELEYHHTRVVTHIDDIAAIRLDLANPQQGSITLEDLNAQIVIDGDGTSRDETGHQMTAGDTGYRGTGGTGKHASYRNGAQGIQGQAWPRSPPDFSARLRGGDPVSSRRKI